MLHFRLSIFLWTLIAILSIGIIDSEACADEQEDGLQAKLESGSVVLRTVSVGSTRYVNAQVLILEPAEKVWTVLANPFEFHRNISSRMEDLDVIVDDQWSSQFLLQ